MLDSPRRSASDDAPGWEPAALAFHRVSRSPRCVPRVPPQTGPVAPRRSGTPILLERGPTAAGGRLVDVLDARRSRRTWPRRPVDRQTFARLLWTSARNRASIADGAARGFVERPYPSGGAAYSLELYPVLAEGAVEALRAGVYGYLPDVHGLDSLTHDESAYRPFLDAAGRSAGSESPPIVIVVTSRFARQSETYGDLAYSLVLKEVGALMQTLYLAAEDLGLAACALGGGSPDALLARLCGATELAEPVVGELMIGPR